MSNDPLLQPFQLKHLTLRNRLMTTAHEPAYTEDGMPKARYRLDHAEKARGGIALTMIGGSVETCGDIANPVARGAVEGDLFDLCSGRVPGRRAPAEITVFRTAAAAISISWSRAIWDRRPDRGEGAEKA